MKTWRSVATIDYASGRKGYSGRYVAFSPDGGTLAFDINESVILWDMASLTLIDRFAQADDVTALAFSPDGKTLASGDHAGVDLSDVSDIVTPVAVIPDANLRAAIRDALGMSPFAPIIVTDMARLTALDASNRNIRELDGP